MVENCEYEASLKRFLYGDQFTELKHLSGAFNLYKMLGVEHKELAHSNLLAYLLDPQREHGLGSRFTNDFFKRIMTASKPDCVPAPLGDKDDVVVRREFMNVDIIVECRSSRHVIAIENKVWHRERQDQLRDYQDRVMKKYKGWSRTLVFLTPSGRPPTTHRDDIMHECPVVSLGYEAVADAVSAVAPVCDERLRCILELTVEHIREDILGGGKMKELVRQIWRDPANRDALHALEEYRPRLSELQDDYFAEVEKLLKKRGIEDGLDPSTYPDKRGDARELKFKIKMWSKHGLPFQFVFHSYSTDPVLKLMLHDSDKKECKDKLDAFARFAPKLVGSEPYAHLDEWHCFNVVLSGEDEERMDKPVVGDAGYGKETITNALAQVNQYLDRLQNQVAEFIRLNKEAQPRELPVTVMNQRNLSIIA